MNTKLEINALKARMSALEDNLARVIAQLNGLATTKALSNLSALFNADANTKTSQIASLTSTVASHTALIATLMEYLNLSTGATGETGATGATGPTGATGATPQVFALDEPGALVDGTLCTWVAAAGSITAAAGVVVTGPTGAMTLTLNKNGVASAVLTWAPSGTTATSSGLPVTLTGGETMTAVLATSVGAANLTANFRGVLS